MSDTTLTFHPAANIFPFMSDEEFSALKVDIAEYGQREPIWLHDGQIIDGRNRYRACTELGITPKFRTWDGQGSLVQFVLSLNLHRRHLNSSQRAALATEILPLLEIEAKQRIVEGAKIGATITNTGERPTELISGGESRKVQRMMNGEELKITVGELRHLLTELDNQEMTVRELRRKLFDLDNQAEYIKLNTNTWRNLGIDGKDSK